MPRRALAILGFLAGVSAPALAADSHDEHPLFPRLTGNYEVSNRTQNVDAVQLPLSINKKQDVEGNKTIVEYAYKNSDLNASRLQFERHFGALVSKLQGELLFAGASEEYPLAMSFRFPQNGKTSWGLVFTQNDEEIEHYTLVVVDTAAPFKP